MLDRVAIFGLLLNHDTGIEPWFSNSARRQQVPPLRLRSGLGRQILIHPPAQLIHVLAHLEPFFRLGQHVGFARDPHV